MVDVERPALAAVHAPLGGEIFDGLVGVVGGEVEVGGVAGPAHGDVGELSAAAVGEDVRSVDRGALRAVHGDGVRVVEAVGG
ncbi:MAG: hypothetical protein KY439_06475 [Actinobacteria bacterium]|nr:hypothetical protein [Actinomycetota bacterium]